jgi:NADH:ubiquinone oxidoreductase subunit 4 (subunit M)
MNILTLLIFTPILFGLVILLLPSSLRASFKYITLFATILQLCFSVYGFICTFKQVRRLRVLIMKISFSLYKNYPG